MAIATITDGLWELLQPLLPTTPRRVRSPGRRRLDHRQVLNGILYVLATGITWDQLPNNSSGWAGTQSGTPTTPAGAPTTGFGAPGTVREWSVR
jgi:transposase